MKTSGLLPHERNAILFMVKHALVGVGAAMIFGGFLFGMDVGGLRTLIFKSDVPIMATIMLFVAMSVTFGSIGIGIGVMTLPEDEGYYDKHPVDDD